MSGTMGRSVLVYRYSFFQPKPDTSDKLFHKPEGRFTFGKLAEEDEVGPEKRGSTNRGINDGTWFAR